MPPSDKFKLNKRAALAALIAAALPVTGFAAAGRVDFAFGKVVAIGADGQRRPLTKGAPVLAGDTIETAVGLAQLRFSDGAKVSVQPNSQFRVDSYNYEGKSDGKERSFFSLLRGGFRTITGLIGRAHRNAYRVRTPVATIGIRGTEYLAELGNSLTVTVGHGRVEICNNAGCQLLYIGDQGYVKNLDSVIQTLRAQGIEIDVEGINQAITQSEETTFVAGDQTLVQLGTEHPDMSSDNGILTYAYADGVEGGISGQYTIDGGEGVTAHFDANGAITDFTSTGGIMADHGDAKLQRAGGDDIITWGRWVDPPTITESGVITCCSPNSFTFSNDSAGLAYVAGIPTPELPHGSATYSLMGYTAPVYGDDTLAATLGTATITGNMGVNFDSGNGSLNMAWQFANGDNVSISGASLSGFSAGGTDPTFSVSTGSGAVGGSLCASSCSASMSGFFAGAGAARAGLGYRINNLDAASAGGDMAGTAAFQKN